MKFCSSSKPATWCFIFCNVVYIIWLRPKLEWTGRFHITWFCFHCKHTVIYTWFWGFEGDPKFWFHSKSYNSECRCCNLSSWACNHSRETVHNSEEKFFNCIRWRSWRNGFRGRSSKTWPWENLPEVQSLLLFCFFLSSLKQVHQQ